MNEEQFRRRSEDLAEYYINDAGWSAILPRLREAYKHINAWTQGCMEEMQGSLRHDSPNERTEVWLEDGPRNTLRALLDYIAFGDSPPKLSFMSRNIAMRNALLTIAESCSGEAVAIAKRTLAVVDEKEDGV